MFGEQEISDAMLLRALPERTKRSHLQVNKQHTPEQVDSCVGGPFGIVRFYVPQTMLSFTKGATEKQQRMELTDRIGDLLGTGFAISIDKSGRQSTKPNGVVAYRITALSLAGAIVLKRGYHNFPDRQDPGPRAIMVEKGNVTDD